jgi:hypothetical protein
MLGASCSRLIAACYGGRRGAPLPDAREYLRPSYLGVGTRSRRNVAMRRLSLLLGLVVALSCAWVAPALAGSSDDQDIADASVLTEDDVFFYGLNETEPEPDEPPKGAVCKGIRASEAAADDAPNAEAAFSDAIGTLVENQVSVFETVKQAKAAMAPYLQAKAIRCAERSLEASLQENLEPGSSYEFNGEPELIPIGDEGMVLPILVTITDPDGAVSDRVLELGAFRVGRALATMSTLNTDEPFPGSEDLASLIADNLEANL